MNHLYLYVNRAWINTWRNSTCKHQPWRGWRYCRVFSLKSYLKDRGRERQREGLTTGSTITFYPTTPSTVQNSSWVIHRRYACSGLSAYISSRHCLEFQTCLPSSSSSTADYQQGITQGPVVLVKGALWGYIALVDMVWSDGGINY